MILVACFALLIVLIVIGVISSVVAMHTRFSATQDELASRNSQRLTDCAIILLAIPSLLPWLFFAANLLFPGGHHRWLWIYALPLLPLSAVFALLGKGPGRPAVLCGLGCMFAATCIGLAVVRNSHFTLFGSM